MAGLANLALWLGWLHSPKCFDLSWSDVTVICPADAASVDLPPHTGMVAFDMQPETKASRNSRMDILMAYCTLSGLNLGPGTMDLLGPTFGGHPTGLDRVPYSCILPLQ
jgi:hypothetical protein